jgi:DNA polymerase/3'-5' exonuclease PolX
MSDGIRVPLAEARAVADELVTILGLGCERIEVAGSVRRGAPDVGDIELVAVPLIESVPLGFFDTAEVSTLDLLLYTLVIQGTLAAPAVRGERYTKLHHAASGLQVDLFIVRPPASWGVIFLIRTGPAAYSQALVTEARRRHFHVAGGALHRGGLGCGAEPCEAIPTPEEKDVYRALGLPFVAPADRR